MAKVIEPERLGDRPIITDEQLNMVYLKKDEQFELGDLVPLPFEKLRGILREIRNQPIFSRGDKCQGQ